MNDTDLAALIGSRICHDLISPLSAIANGVELLQLTTPTLSDEMQLISQSVDHANARIRFFRIAFGHSAEHTFVPKQELSSIMDGFNTHSRMDLVWDVDTLDRNTAKTLFLLILCFESALAFGGTLTIIHNDQGWDLSAKSDRLNIDTDHWNMLENSETDHAVIPSHVHFPMAGDMLAAHQTPSTVTMTENEVRVSF